jgi:hypothetical protein
VASTHRGFIPHVARATIEPMTSRRSGRPTHVRPRPPSTGRPAPVTTRPRAPAPGRLATHRPVERGGRIPLIVRAMLAVLVIALGAGILSVAAGGLGTVAKGIGGALGSFVDGVTATPVPIATEVPVSTTPDLAQPSEPYTSQETVDLLVTVPASVARDADHRIRVYLALKDQSPTPIDEVPVGALQRTIVPVALTKGTNDFTVTIVGPGGESEASPVVRYVLDTTIPKVTLTSPESGAVINRAAVEVAGRTQGRSTLIARNGDNGTSVSGTAAEDGTFTLAVPIAFGSNVITISATDPAGNIGQGKVTVRRGTGKLTVSLSASVYRLKPSSLPEPIRLTAIVSDPDGRRLAGAEYTFTLSIPGIPTVTGTGTTGRDGSAHLETTIPKGADPGQGIATVLVTTGEFGRTQDRVVLTILP